MGDVGNRKPPKEHRIKPGQIKNPLGARAHNKEVMALRRLAAPQVAEIGTLVVDGNIDALSKIIEESKGPDSPHSVLKVWMATVAAKALKNGDHKPMDTILNRIVGKPKESIEFSGSVNTGNMTDAQLEARTAAMLKRLSGRIK